MKHLNIKIKKGFTLIEMVTVIALISILTVIVSVFLSQSVKAYRIKSQTADLEEKSAHVMREFEQTGRAASAVLTASETEFKFYRFFDLTSTYPTQVRYFLDGNKFKIGLTQPEGVAPNITYPAGSEKITLIIENVVNTDVLFKYYNGNGDLLTDPVNVVSVRMVELSISLDQNPGVPPEPVVESTKINLRNMKDNL
jgi:prepilin-type N-terminal cleavage/methylation domain-containing protein